MRNEHFTVDAGFLVRHVTTTSGSTYEHACQHDAFREVAHAIDELNGAPFVLEDLAAATSLPWSQVSTALAFFKERGCVVPARGRAHVSATTDVYLDAMIEWCALAQDAAA